MNFNRDSEFQTEGRFPSAYRFLINQSLEVNKKYEGRIMAIVSESQGIEGETMTYAFYLSFPRLLKYNYRLIEVIQPNSLRFYPVELTLYGLEPEESIHLSEIQGEDFEHQLEWILKHPYSKKVFDQAEYLTQEREGLIAAVQDKITLEFLAGEEKKIINKGPEWDLFIESVELKTQDINKGLFKLGMSGIRITRTDLDESGKKLGARSQILPVGSRVSSFSQNLIVFFYEPFFMEMEVFFNGVEIPSSFLYEFSLSNLKLERDEKLIFKVGFIPRNR